MFKNLINGKKYVGSSENLRRRFLEYFDSNYLLRKKCMNICDALLKHDYSNFSIEILEYCEPSK
jgi:group I intron endonuclease